jgi:cell division protein FtsB
MENEDFTSLIALRLDPQISTLSKDLEALKATRDSLEREIEDLKHEIKEKEKLQGQLNEVENE